MADNVVDNAQLPPPAAAGDDAAAGLAANMQQLDINTNQGSKFDALVFSGKPDQHKDFYLEHWELQLTNADIPRPKWAAKAAGKLAPEVLQSLFSIGYNVTKLATTSWEEFSAAFKALPVGALEATVLAKLQALEKLAWIITKNKVAAALTEVEKIFAQIPDLADIIKIYFVIKAVHPGLASRISYTTEGKDFESYAAFRSNLQSQAVIFESRGPSGAPGGDSPSAGRRGRRLNGHNGGPSKPHFNFKRRPHTNGNAGSGNKKPRRDLSEVKCYRCQQYGHYADQCPQGKESKP